MSDGFKEIFRIATNRTPLRGSYRIKIRICNGIIRLPLRGSIHKGI